MKTSAFVAMAAALGLAAPVCLVASSAARAQTAAQERQAFAPDLVRDIQHSLNQRGYGVGPVDGVFGHSTRSALQRFQRDNSLPGNGRVNQQTLAALGITGVMAQGQAGVPQGQVASPAMVRDIQTELRRLGYDVGRVNGIWDARTEKALKEFQSDRNLPTSGQIDARTLAALQAGGAAPQTGQAPSESEEGGQ